MDTEKDGEKFGENDLSGKNSERKKRGRTYGTGRVFRPKYRYKGQLVESKRWSIAYPVNGQERREPAKTKVYAEALGLLKRRLGEAQAGRLPAFHAKVTFQQLMDMKREHLVTNDRSKDTIYRFDTCVRPPLDAFFHTTALATDIDNDRVAKYKAQRIAAGVTPGTVNVELSSLRHGFRLAVERGLLTVAPTVKNLSNQRRRTGFLEYDVFRAILAAMPDHFHGLFEAAYITGWRVRSELTTREWRHVDFQAGELRLEPGEAKDKSQGRVFPFRVVPDLRAIMKRQRAYVDGIEQQIGRPVKWVFCRPNGQRLAWLDYSWRAACAKVKMKRLIHDLRRTAVRNLEMAGVDRPTAMRLVGHKTESIYLRYAIINQGNVDTGASRLASFHQWLKASHRKRAKKAS